MCNTRPGQRCAREAGGEYDASCAQYRAAHPNGPAVGTLTSARAMTLLKKVVRQLNGDAARDKEWAEVQRMRAEREQRAEQERQRRLKGIEARLAREEASAAALADARPWISARADELTFTPEVAGRR